MSFYLGKLGPKFIIVKNFEIINIAKLTNILILLLVPLILIITVNSSIQIENFEAKKYQPEKLVSLRIPYFQYMPDGSQVFQKFRMASLTPNTR